MKQSLFTASLTAAIILLISGCSQSSTYREAHKDIPVIQSNLATLTNSPLRSTQTATKENWLKDPYIRWSLLHMQELIQTKPVWRGRGQIVPLLAKLQPLDCLSVRDETGTTMPLKALLHKTKTDAFLVTHQGKVVYERYGNHMQSHQQHATASLSKAFTGLIISMLAEEGKISLNKTADEYIPELKGTAFGNATVQQLMDMEVAAKFPAHGFKQAGLSNQDAQLYLASGLLQRTQARNAPKTIYNMLQEAKEIQSPGLIFSYNNGCTETLGWIIKRITGRSLSKEVSTRIWSKLGAQEDAYYVSDAAGTEQASAGFNVSPRDMLRFGEMIMHNGLYGGKQIISQSIVKEIQNSVPTHAFRNSKASINKPGYSYHNQWWLTHNKHKAFEITGSYGQRLYIDPTTNMVIVHFSSNANHNLSIHHTFTDVYMKLAHHLQHKD